MIRPGLVSITFRKLTPREIVDLVAKSGLETIEWGGDIHVPHGDVVAATEVAKMTADAGLRTAAYGSYYRVGHEEPIPFERIVVSAMMLEAPTIRVWPGRRGSADADDAYRAHVVSESQRIAAMAQDAGLTLSFEYHGHTLTDTGESARRLMEEIDHPAMRCYWQAAIDTSVEDRLGSLRGILPHLTNLHVYHWQPGAERWPIAKGAEEWRQYLEIVAGTGREHAAMIEFVRDDSEDAFIADAMTLRAWTDAANNLSG